MDPWWLLPVAARLLPPVLLVPVGGGRRVPLPARLALVAVLAWPVAGMIVPATGAPSGMALLLLVVREVAAGTVLALAAASLFAVLEMAGQLIDVSTGGGRIQLPGLLAQQRQGALSQLYLLVGVLLFFGLGGPRVALEQLLHSYRLLPLTSTAGIPLANELLPDLLALVAGSYQLACRLALPVLAALLLADCLLGLCNRTAQQLPVFFLGMPLKAALGMAAAALALPETAAGFGALWLG